MLVVEVLCGSFCSNWKDTNNRDISSGLVASFVSHYSNENLKYGVGGVSDFENPFRRRVPRDTTEHTGID